VLCVFTLVEAVVEKYTLIIDYHAWAWYWTWLSMALMLYIVMVVHKWFFRIKNVFSL
jgi:hypothetical protein